MHINYDVQKINTVLEDFFYATGINMDLVKSDMTAIGDRSRWENIQYCKYIQQTPDGKVACKKSDKFLLEKCKQTHKAQMHVCHAGLIDIVAPILYSDSIIGYIIFGQMRSDIDFSEIEKHIENLGLNTGMMQSLYKDIPVFEKQRIHSIENIANMLIKYLLLENMLQPDYDNAVQKAVQYIDENLGTDLSIATLCKQIHISKSTLYKRFHACFNTTLSEYITEKRIEKAVELLKTTDLSIEDISQKTGFSSASYFSKMFKKLQGISPLKYKRTTDKK